MRPEFSIRAAALLLSLLLIITGVCPAFAEEAPTESTETVETVVEAPEETEAPVPSETAPEAGAGSEPASEEPAEEAEAPEEAAAEPEEETSPEAPENADGETAAPADEGTPEPEETPVRSVYSVEQEDSDLPPLETAASLEELAFYVAFFRSEMNLNDAMIAALLANIERESAYRPFAEDEPGQSYGLFQWLGSRRESLMSFCEDYGLAPDTRETQLRFLQYELEAFYPGVLWQLNAWEDCRDNAAAAAAMFCEVYEGVADTDFEVLVRSRLARDFFYDLLSEPALSSLAAAAVIPALPAPVEAPPAEESPAPAESTEGADTAMPEEPVTDTDETPAAEPAENAATEEEIPTEEPETETPAAEPAESAVTEEAAPAEETPAAAETAPEPAPETAETVPAAEAAPAPETPSVSAEEQEYLDSLSALLSGLRDSVAKGEENEDLS